MTIERGGENLARMRISVTTLGDMLLNSWYRDPAQLAISFPSGTRTYDELVANVLLRARRLWAQGVRPRQHVGILMPSGIEFLETLFSVSMIGGVSVLLNARYKAPEIGRASCRERVCQYV